jgi:predicted helicase
VGLWGDDTQAANVKGLPPMRRYWSEAHLGYEDAPRFELQWVENPNEPLSYRVTGRMRLNKTAGSIEVNNSLTLTGIPEAAFD